MQSGNGEKRASRKSPARKAPVDIDEVVLDIDTDALEAEIDEIAPLRAEHEALRRQVALLNAQLDEKMEPQPKPSDPTMPVWPMSAAATVLIASVTLIVGLLVSRQRTTRA